MIRVLVIHEVRLTCELEATALRKEMDIEIVGCMTEPHEALEWLKRLDCDIALVSINLPADSAFSFVPSALKLNDKLKLIITGVPESKAVILHCLEEGAAGYVHIGESLTDLTKKIRHIYAGESLIPPDITMALMARVNELKRLVTELQGFQDRQPLHLYAELTQRECEVLELIEQGMNNQEIANVLCIEMGTVKNHVHNIFDKFGVRTRKQAAIIARQALTSHRVGAIDDPQAAMLSGGSSYLPELKSKLTVTDPRQPTLR